MNRRATESSPESAPDPASDTAVPRIRAVIVDDEPLARRGVVARLSRWPDVQVLAEAHDAPTGVAMIRAHRPNVVFLDIEMPGASGFVVLTELPPAERPLAVFITAHDDRALEAFEVQAFDYLLKPINDERLARTIDNLRARLDERDSSRDASRDTSAVHRIFIRDRGRVVALEPESIDWVQSDGDYVRIYAGHQHYLHHATITAFAALLPVRQFARIHRGAVVNIARIASLSPLTNGDCTVELTTGARLKLSRTRRAELDALLGGAL